MSKICCGYNICCQSLVVSHSFITLCPLFHFFLVSPPLFIPPFLHCFSQCLCPLSSQSSVHALQKEGVELFSELVKSVELMSTQVGELLCTYEASMGSRSEGHIHKLEQELAQLRRKDQELSRLASMQDHICFLKVQGDKIMGLRWWQFNSDKCQWPSSPPGVIVLIYHPSQNFFTLEPLTQNGGREGLGLGEEALVSEIQTVMEELRDGLKDLCKSSMAKLFRTGESMGVFNGLKHIQGN